VKIALVFNKDREGTTGFYIERILKDSPHLKVDHFNTSDVGNIQPEYDLYCRIDHGDYQHDLPLNLKPKVFWALDTHLKHPSRKIVRQAVNYDLVFCALKQSAQQMQRLGINAYWIPFACDPSVHKPRAADKKYDLAFVGTEGKGYRPKLLRRLKKRYPNSFIGKADFKQLDEIYSSAKIGFNYAIRHRGKKVGCNMRFFEILCCQTLLLNNWIEDCRIEELGFQNDMHLVMYKNRRQLFKLIDYYLAHEEKREVIAKNGYEQAIKSHTYRNRVEEMFQLIRGNFGTKFKELQL